MFWFENHLSSSKCTKPPFLIFSLLFIGDIKGQHTETLLAGSLAKALCCILGVPAIRRVPSGVGVPHRVALPEPCAQEGGRHECLQPGSHVSVRQAVKTRNGENGGLPGALVCPSAHSSLGLFLVSCWAGGGGGSFLHPRERCRSWRGGSRPCGVCLVTSAWFPSLTSHFIDIVAYLWSQGSIWEAVGNQTQNSRMVVI